MSGIITKGLGVLGGNFITSGFGAELIALLNQHVRIKRYRSRTKKEKEYTEIKIIASIVEINGDISSIQNSMQKMLQENSSNIEVKNLTVRRERDQLIVVAQYRPK